MSYCLVRVYQCCVHLNIWYLDIIQFPQISAFCVNIHSASHPSPWTPRPLPSRPRASSTGLINHLFPAPASSNARNYTEWATQTTFINVEFFNSFGGIDWFMICLGPGPSSDYWCGLITPVLPGDTGWQVDMITHKLPEPSGQRPRASMKSMKTNF